MKTISRNTEVISVSLPKTTAQKLDKVSKNRGQTRSQMVASLIDQLTEEERWQKIYRLGEKTALRFKITSEEDIDRILHEAA